MNDKTIEDVAIALHNAEFDTQWGELTEAEKKIERRRAKAAADAYVASSRSKICAWQDISTAPNDGSHILAYKVPNRPGFTNLTDPPAVVHWFDDPERPGFYTSVNEIEPEYPFEATHWMPLPEPPK